ncbi:MAG: phosphoribosylanthranilate isomerase [Planctomycetes bacterium]|nr:phosphoribosylanthranilate isomerase [Planctomycetota bacterium]
MALWIKICGIRDLATAQFCVDHGANAIGLVFADSPRKVLVEEAREIAAGLPAGVEKIGVFKDSGVDKMLRVARDAGLTAIQCHYPSGGAAPGGLAVELIPAFAADALGKADFGFLADRRYLVDSPAGPGSGRAWDYARAAQGKGRAIVAGGLTPDNVANAIKRARPYGIDVSSGVESKRGIKDVALIKDFIGAARAAEKEMA